jgi:hypothetical protein
MQLEIHGQIIQPSSSSSMSFQSLVSIRRLYFQCLIGGKLPVMFIVCPLESIIKDFVKKLV